MSNTGNHVIVETEQLINWKAQMNTLNMEAIDKINDIVSSLNSLKDSWKGESASGFENVMDDTLKKIVQCHEDMSNVENFLSTAVSVYTNQ